MKPWLMLSILAALLGGCVVAPVGYRDGRNGYYQDRGYDRYDGRYQNRTPKMGLTPHT